MHLKTQLNKRKQEKSNGFSDPCLWFSIASMSAFFFLILILVKYRFFYLFKVWIIMFANLRELS